VQIILADDHSLIRDSLKQYLVLLSDDVNVTEAASLPEVVIHAGATPPPDLILLDLQMPGMNGPRSVGDVRQLFPDTPVVVISGYTEPNIIRAVMNYGANGYIPKTARGKSLVTALRLVLDGETYLPPSLLEEIKHTAQQAASVSTATQQNTSTGASPASGFSKLSVREAETLRLLIEGKTNKEIARVLNLQEVTVKVHLRNVYRKIKAANRTDAVRIAMEQGWR
jgi:two-component system nitrate/nitrite response regulator NarL